MQLSNNTLLALIHVDSSARVGWVSEPKERGTLGIIWGCLLVLFACVWSVLHHNVPDPAEGYWELHFRKMRWATLAIAAPELLSLFAIMQWNAANISVKEMRGLGVTGWSSVHAFYANAGGFLLETPDAPAFPVNATSICYLVSKGRIDAPIITKEEIWDKSKADLFAKCVAFVQAGWLLCAMIGRAAQKLPITPIELFTIAFVVPTMATQYFWANKPQNIGAPVTISVDWTIADLLLEVGDIASGSWVDTPMDFIEKPVWQGWKRRPSLLHFGGLNIRPLTRIPNDYSPPPPTGREATLIWVISVVHAGIHLLGWEFQYPTDVETFLWRVSSVTLVVVMAIGGIVPVLSTADWFDYSFNLLWIWVREADEKTWVKEWLFASVVNIAYVMYILARLIIFAEMFCAFRSLPARAYLEVEWSSFLPHV